MVSKRKPYNSDELRLLSWLPQTTANRRLCPPKAEVVSSNLAGCAKSHRNIKQLAKRREDRGAVLLYLEAPRKNRDGFRAPGSALEDIYPIRSIPPHQPASSSPPLFLRNQLSNHHH